MPGIRPPQPSGLIPSAGIIAGAATTQPMSFPRPSAPPTRPATKRLVLSGGLGAKVAPEAPTGSVHLPIGMILRCLPPEVLAADVSEFENSGAAATEVALPIHLILNQLPSGKVEIPFQDLVANFPPGFLQPEEAIASYAVMLINLPLMEVVMRIPPDLLALRPDQKDVDAAAASLADPFTEESFREQAEGARRAQGHANIVDESQVAPAEEFVPQAAAPPETPPQPTLPNRAIVPPARTTSTPPIRPGMSAIRSPNPTILAPATGPTPVARPASAATARPVTPLRPTSPIPPVPSSGESVPPPPPRPPLLSASQSLSASQAIPAPRPPAFRMPSKPPAESGLPRIIPAIPTTPTIPIPASEIPAPAKPEVSPFAPTIPLPVQSTEAASPAAGVPLPPDKNADELQRLAARAMQESGEAPQSTSPAGTSQAHEPEKPASSWSPSPVPAKPEPIIAATARLKLPEFPPREMAPTAPVTPPITPPDAGRLPNRPELSRRSITTRVPAEEMPPQAPPAPAPDASSGAVAINLNSCSADDLLPIPGLGRELADAIVRHRAKIGEFRKLEDLLEVPGMTRAAYSNLTGENPPTGVHQSLNELLGFPAGQEVTLKDVTDRIACWPDVTGCLLSENNGLVLVGSVPDSLNKEAIVAFAPRMFEELNKSFSEIASKQTDDLIIPTTGTSFHILRNKELYLTILSRVPQMPERHMKIARYVLAALSIRPG
jgi:competence ComEA-like helix-hairpin-helix protein